MLQATFMAVKSTGGRFWMVLLLGLLSTARRVPPGLSRRIASAATATARGKRIADHRLSITGSARSTLPRMPRRCVIENMEAYSRVWRFEEARER